MIGFHAQGNVDHWPDAVRRLPPGTPYKVVDGVQRCVEAKGVNPGVYTVVRHHVGEQNPAGNKHQKAREFFASFVDDTFRGLARHVDAVQEWNEYFANSQDQTERNRWIAWAQACVDVWRDEYRTQSDYAHIDLILAETSIGNDIPPELAKMSHDNRNWVLLGYHPYVPVWRGEIRPDDWTYYSGRWEQMDIRYRRLGYTVRWFFGEGGAVGHNGPGFPNSLAPNDGWRHRDVYNGNVDAYLNMMRYWMDSTIETHAWKRGDVTGVTLFTSGGGDQWKWFEVKQPEMSRIADFVANYMAGVDRPDKPPPPDPTPGELANPSFEDGWTDQSMQAQKPNGWGLHIHTEGEVRGRPINGGPECVHKHENQLPPDEQPGGENALILDGEWVYKMFTQATWKAELPQTASGLEPGDEYKATVPVNVHFDGRPDEYDPEDALFEIHLSSGEPVRHWTTKENERQWHYLECFGIAGSNGMITLNASPSVKWEHPTSFFIDDIRLEKVTEKPPPDPDPCRGAPRDQYKRTVLVAHSAATKQQWLSVAQAAFDNKQSAGFSYDDAGIGDLDNRTAVLYGIEQARRDEFAHWYAQNYPGVVVQFRDYATAQFEIVDIVDTLPTHEFETYNTRSLDSISDLVIHHTVSPDDRTSAQIAYYHVNSRGWPGIGYHYVIGADGTIEQVNYHDTVSYHAGGANSYSIGIALKGDFTDVQPYEAQLQAAEWLVDRLRNDGELSIDIVLGHKETAGAATACPGDTWDDWKSKIV